MKLYVHFNEPPLPAATAVVQITKERLQLAQIQQVLQNCLRDKGVTIPQDSEVRFYKGNKPVDSAQPVGKHFYDTEDITAKFVSLAVKKKNSNPTCQKPILKPDEKRRLQVQEIINNHGNMKTRLLPDGKTEFNPKTVADWLMLGEKWRVLGEPRKTVDILLVLLKTDQGQPDMYEQIVKIYLEANRPVLAGKYVEKSLTRFPEYTRMRLREAECLMALNQPDPAIKVLKAYAKALRRRQGNQAKMEEKHEVQLALCRAYQLKGQKDMALVVILGVVRELQERNAENVSAMIEYARLTFDLSEKHASEAATIILAALIGDRANKFWQRALAETCQKNGGIDKLLHIMKDSVKDPEALVFMANIIRKYGAIKEALGLLEKAMSLKTRKPSTLLSYMHMLEITQDYQKAFDTSIELFQQNPEAKVGHVTNQDVLTCVKPCIGQKIFSFSPSQDRATPGVHGKNNSDSPRATASCDPGVETDTAPPGVHESNYTEDDLYQLACWFTLAKMLYLNGALTVVSDLVKTLDPLHRGKSLHTTLIRNEAAFYSAISQTAQTWQDPCLAPCVPQRSHDWIYLLGDSHCLSPAWKTIEYRNKPHVIRPLLSTGTKVWHLRRGEVFYPRVNFTHCVRQIPTRASVVVLFGEIDCREALHVCYNKCRYESLEEGIEVLIEIYLQVLRDLQTEHKWTVFVHPVPPVLEVTRTTVMLFNELLQKHLQLEKDLHWLDIVDDLFEPETSTIKYEFDKTHLHPSYVPLLESAMNEVSETEDAPWAVD